MGTPWKLWLIQYSVDSFQIAYASEAVHECTSTRPVIRTRRYLVLNARSASLAPGTISSYRINIERDTNMLGVFLAVTEEQIPVLRGITAESHYGLLIEMEVLVQVVLLHIFVLHAQVELLAHVGDEVLHQQAEHLIAVDTDNLLLHSRLDWMRKQC